MIVHISNPTKITEDYLKVYREDLTIVGFPLCKYCNKRIRKGSYIDPHFPYESDQSFHIQCWRKHHEIK